MTAMNENFIWGFRGNAREGNVVSFFSDTLSDPDASRDDIKFKIHCLTKHENGDVELDGLAFYGADAERQATLVLDPDYYETDKEFDSVGRLTLHP